MLLKTNEKQGTVFIRTDQLDGETDWKPRDAIRFIQNQPLRHESDLITWNSLVDAEPPSKEIYKFEGTFEFGDVMDRRMSVHARPRAVSREDQDDASSVEAAPERKEPVRA